MKIEILKNKTLLLLGALVIITLFLKPYQNTYDQLDKPWFAFPFIGHCLVYLAIGGSIYRSYTLFNRSQSCFSQSKIKKLKTAFISFWVTYVIGFVVLAKSIAPIFFLIVPVMLFAIGIYIIVICFDDKKRVAKRLNIAQYICVYLLVIGLYIFANN
jgi:cobalamin synthase